MNFCTPVQQLCKRLCPKQKPIAYMKQDKVSNDIHNANKELRNSNDEKQKSYTYNKRPTINHQENKNKKYEEEEEPSRDSSDLFDFNIRRGSKANGSLIQEYRSSSSTSFKEALHRKKRTNSIFGGPAINLAQEKYKSGDSRAKLNRNQRPKTAGPKRKNVANYNDPVRDEWANKGAMVYTSHRADNQSKPNPTKYWVQTELQYVIILPTDNLKKAPFKPPPLTSQSPSKTSSQSTKLSQSSSPEEWMKPLPETELEEQEKESFLSVFSSTSSNDSFIPRSKAKPAPKPKGRFCCAKRQTSE